MTRDEMLAAIRDWHREWAAEASTRAIPQPEYQTDGPSQYAETLVDMSATPEDEAAYWAGVNAIMQRYYASSDSPSTPSDSGTPSSSDADDQP